MTNAPRLAAASLAAVSVLFAGFSQANTTFSSAELRASVGIEIECLANLVEAIDAILEESERGKMSAKGKRSHSRAKELYREAEDLYRAKNWKASYRKVRDAKRAVMPAATEVLARGVDPETRKAVAEQVRCAAARVSGIAELLKEDSPPAAAAAFERAESLYTEGNSLYEAGRYRDAFRRLEACLTELDKAIRELSAA